MKKFLAALAFSAAASGAWAYCTGSDSLSICSDNSGNTYTVQRFGDTTFVNGSNASTGSTWNQTSQSFGDTTFHNGTAANGNSWSATDQRVGDTSFRHGIDSRGNSFSRICNAYGCH